MTLAEQVCWVCGRVATLSVYMEGDVRAICETCWSKGDEGVTIPLDYTEDDDA